MSWVDTLLGRDETEAEAARRRGELVYDEVSNSWVEIDALPCRHTYVKINNGTITCTRCSESRER